MPTDPAARRRYARRAMTAPRAETERCIPAAPPGPIPRPGPTTASPLSWLGHATVLLNFAGPGS